MQNISFTLSQISKSHYVYQIRWCCWCAYAEELMMTICVIEGGGNVWNIRIVPPSIEVVGWSVISAGASWVPIRRLPNTIITAITAQQHNTTINISTLCTTIDNSIVQWTTNVYTSGEIMIFMKGFWVNFKKCVHPHCCGFHNIIAL